MESILIREFVYGTMKFHITSDNFIPEETYQKIVTADKFLNWVKNMEREQANMTLTQVEIQSYDMFGPRLGFLKFAAHVTNKKNGRVYNAFVFLRGDAVAVLVVLVVSGRKYIVVTKQPRIPVGQFRCVETCAGMLEQGENDPSKVKVRALTELKEEIGLAVDLSKVVDLTAWAGMSDGILLSPGGCDEKMKLFFVEQEVTLSQLSSLQGKATGDGKEDIITSVVPYESWTKSDDAKLRLCVQMYEQYSSRSRVQPSDKVQKK